ncbi:MAG: DUF3465 domain-containing protein [Myxococcota bacterium]
MNPSRRSRPKRSLAALLGLILLAALLRLAGFESFSLPSAASPQPAPTEAGDAAARRLARAFAERESGFMVTFEGEVSKVLADDRDGSRHQRFLVRIEGGDQTLLVAHNIDLAERVPLAPGDRLRLRGQYEWNDRGGVLHWTHHDPDGRHPGGFIEADGRRFE